jgi:hypothetical protein
MSNLLSTSSRVQLRYIPETTFGQTPAAGNGAALRFTGESLDFKLKTESSKEIRADRQITDLIQVGADASGGFNFEFSFQEYDALLEAVFQGTWDTTTMPAQTSGRLVNGTTQRSFTLEKAFTDINQVFAYRGMVASKLSLDIKSGSILTGSFDFTGKDSIRSAATTLPGVLAASHTGDSMNCVKGVGTIMEGGAALAGTFVKSIKLDMDNAVRAQDAVAVFGTAGIASGTLKVTGTIEVYFADGTLYDKFLNNSATSLSFKTLDNAGNGYAWTLPKMKYSGGKITAGAIDQDVMVSMPFQALLDPTSGHTIILDRIGAVS